MPKYFIKKKIKNYRNKMKIIFLVVTSKISLMVTRMYFCKSISAIFIFGHFFCPFLKFRKNFYQKNVKNHYTCRELFIGKKVKYSTKM